MARIIHIAEPVATWVFDHDSPPRDWLAAAASALGGKCFDVEASSEEAIGVALASRSRAIDCLHVLLVHINVDGFKSIEDGCGPNAVVVRCSTSPTELSYPAQKDRPLILNLRNPLNASFSTAMLAGLIKGFKDNVPQLREGLLPDALRSYFRIQPLGYLAALLILLEGAIHAPALRRRESILSPAWWHRGLGIPPKSTATELNGKIAEIIDILEREIGAERGKLSEKAPSSNRLLERLTGQGSLDDQLWSEIKKELEAFV